jgi:glycyl-tRNA synthetase beta chain
MANPPSGARVREELRRRGRGALALTTDKGTWLAFRGTEAGATTKASLGGIVNQASRRCRSPSACAGASEAPNSCGRCTGSCCCSARMSLTARCSGLAAGRITFGHRFMRRAEEPEVGNGYEAALAPRQGDRRFRRRRESDPRRCRPHSRRPLGGRALIEAELLDEVTALVEWPVPIAGQFEQRFLALPREVVIATVQDHQRYFPVEATDGSLTAGSSRSAISRAAIPRKIREGNERVVRPRLSDAAFFWEQDRRLRLEDHAAKLAGVTFQTKLGSYADKTRRVEALSVAIGRGDRRGPAGRARGAIGEGRSDERGRRRISRAAGHDGTVLCRRARRARGIVPSRSKNNTCRAMPATALPLTKTGQALALADKIDTLVGIFAIDQKPTGTKDPFGLRRAALGVLRILLEGRLDLNLLELLELSAAAQPVQRAGRGRGSRVHRRAPARPAARARRRHDHRDDRCGARGRRARRSMSRRGCRRSSCSCNCPKPAYWPPRTSASPTSSRKRRTMPARGRRRALHREMRNAACI